MKELLTTVAKALVDHPDSVEVREVEGERSVILELKVHPDDVGKVIGRSGRIIDALRTIVKASAAKQQKRASVELL